MGWVTIKLHANRKVYHERIASLRIAGDQKILPHPWQWGKTKVTSGQWQCSYALLWLEKSLLWTVAACATLVWCFLSILVWASLKVNRDVYKSKRWVDDGAYCWWRWVESNVEWWRLKKWMKLLLSFVVAFTHTTESFEVRLLKKQHKHHAGRKQYIKTNDVI